MVETRYLKRTVAFWQFVNAVDLNPLNQVDWAGFMAEVAENARHGRSRHEIDDSEITGRAYTRDDVDNLVLTKVRDDMPRQQSRSTGDVADMATTSEDWEVVESAFIHFLPFGNVFSILRSQITAPSPQAVARWINKTKILDVQLAVEPVIDPERWTRLRQAGGVSSLEIAGPSAVLRQPVRGPLDHYLHPARHTTGKVLIKIDVGRSRNPADAAQRHDLYLATEELERAIGTENLNKAKVRVFDEDADGVPTEMINLLRQRFTIQRHIALNSERRASVSEPSALDAIMTAVEKFDDDLRAAVRDDPMA
ncbi:MAG: hypothetical protein J0I34_33455 [Pseudonocardia sp.]|uniref:hypothetical protein n=1 Tax=Pseudonocardia sp. TaxID=60912 RepID=UPI00086A0AA9|nr:hypothetical protein [Pseudonocardia sp.]MBN9113668.1 hypothetical protein [Pseudonocardia sp.]ODU28825.1 MAG: hypothetical protein ABS80_02245 [Pseudonocardia sp. SCN 72-51]